MLRRRAARITTEGANSGADALSCPESIDELEYDLAVAFWAQKSALEVAAEKRQQIAARVEMKPEYADAEAITALALNEVPKYYKLKGSLLETPAAALQLGAGPASESATEPPTDEAMLTSADRRERTASEAARESGWK